MQINSSYHSIIVQFCVKVSNPSKKFSSYIFYNCIAEMSCWDRVHSVRCYKPVSQTSYWTLLSTRPSLYLDITILFQTHASTACTCHSLSFYSALFYSMTVQHTVFCYLIGQGQWSSAPRISLYESAHHGYWACPYLALSTCFGMKRTLNIHGTSFRVAWITSDASTELTENSSSL